MRRDLLLILLTFAITAGATLNISAQSKGKQAPPPPISLTEFYERGLAGETGALLGTYISVSGVVIENTSRWKAHEGLPFFVSIDEVNGIRLTKPAIYSSSEMKLSQDLPNVKIGDRFRCIGYETGCYRGQLASNQIYRDPVMISDVGFGFRTNFVVVEASLVAR